jgi:hypothetical protein
VIEAHTKLRVREPYDPHPHVPLAPSALAREVNPLGGPAPPYHPDRDHTVVNGAQTAATPTTAPAPAPTILQSMFSWWGPSTEVGTLGSAAAAAPAPEGAEAPNAESAVSEEPPTEGPSLHQGASETQLSTSHETQEKTASQPTHSTTAVDTAGPPGVAAANASAASSAPSATAAVTPSPMSKISERLQQIREQKVQYQQKNRHKPTEAPGV